MVTAEDRLLQLLLVGIGHGTCGPLRQQIRITEGDAPVQEEPEPCLHGVRPRLHHYKLALGDGLQFIRRHERPLHHLEGAAGAVFSAALAHRTAHDGAAAQGLGQHLGGLRVGGEAAEDGILRIVDNNLRALLAVVLLQLCQRLNDRHQSQFAGPAGAEQGQDIESGHGAQLIAEQHHPVGQLAAVLVRHGEQLTGECLDHQAGHEVLAGVFFRQNEEDGRLLGGKGFRVNGTVEAQHLLQLGVQEGVQPGQHRGHDRGHGLLRRVEGGAGEPPGLVSVGQRVH